MNQSTDFQIMVGPLFQRTKYISRMFYNEKALIIMTFQFTCFTVYCSKDHTCRFIAHCHLFIYNYLSIIIIFIFLILCSRWIRDIKNHERKVFSQNGEDGVLEFIFDQIGTIQHSNTSLNCITNVKYIKGQHLKSMLNSEQKMLLNATRDT